jgi:ATP-dependent helicase/nuclease subunit A
VSDASVAERRAADLAARVLATREFRAPLVLEAGAGTGKTSALVARIATWSLGAGWERAAARDPHATPDAIAARVLERIVAITFTEAAAAEMAGRVAKALATVERGKAPEGMEPPADPSARERARHLLASLDRLVVRTIHAFCRRLLAAHPLQAGVHPEFQVDAEGTGRAALVREVVEAELAVGYAARDEDLLALARERHGPAAIERAVCELLEAGMPAAALRESPFPAERVRATTAELREAVDAACSALGERLTGVRGSTTEATAKALVQTARLLATPVESPDALAKLGKDLAGIWDDRWIERLRRWGRRDFGQSEERAIGDAADAFASTLPALVRWLVALRGFDPEALELARRVLAPLVARAETELRARGIVSFSDLLVGARDLLARREDVAAGARRAIDQLLVDEFQDTDRMQCQVVAALALDGPRDERPGLFVVGDPKQSIYGWRSADLRAYEEFVERVRAEGGQVHSLVVNFRSVPAVLDEVERAMARTMLAEPGLQPRFERLVPCPEREHHPGFRAGRAAPVEHWISWHRERREQTLAADAAEIEARAVAADLRRLHDAHGVAWRDVGLLFRSRGDLDVYLDALRDAGIPYAVEGDRSHYQRREVIDAAALVRCAIDPHDQLSLVTALRSAVVGVPDAALIPLWTRGFPDRAARLGDDAAAAAAGEIEEIVREVARSLPDDVPGLERVRGWEASLLHFVRALARLRATFRSEPPDRFVEELRAVLLLDATEAARYQGLYRLANLDVLFRRLLADLSESAPGAQAVLRDLRRRVQQALAQEEGRPGEAIEDAVQVHTIHQAKGLGFAHVYVLQLQKQSAGEASGVTLAARGPHGFEYRVLGASTAGLAAVSEDRERLEGAELVRTLYVAMTRAKDRLVLAGRRPGESAAGARTHADLLRLREGGAPDPEELFAELSGDGSPAHADRAGARWVFPALDPALSEPAVAPEAPARIAPIERVSEASARIRSRRADAGLRMRRAIGGAASAEAHRELREQLERGPERPGRAVAARLATAVGSAVHAALERLDLRAAAEAEVARAKANARAVLPGLIAGPELAHAESLCDQALERFASGPLHARLRALADRVVARELDLVAEPEGPDPIVFEAGAIDLVYRDPADGRLVVADYKTDRVDGDQEIARRAAAYASQGRVYARALGRALGLDYRPRFELWFLHAGRVELPPVEE